MRLTIKNILDKKTTFLNITKTVLMLAFSAIYTGTIAQVNLSSSLTACYALNGNASEPVNNQNGTLSSVTSTVNRFGTANSALYFSGNSSSYVTLPNSPYLKPSNAVTCAGWVTVPALGQDMILVFAKNTYSSYFTSYSNCIKQYGSSYRFFSHHQDGGTSTDDYVISTTSIVPNTWYHFAFTVDNTSLKMYVNGVLEDSIQSVVQGFNYDPTESVYLGGTNSSIFNIPFTGTLDNIRFYSRVLNGAEISALYSQDPQCLTIPAPTASFSTSSNTICIGQNITFTNQSTGGSTYQWNFTGGSPASSTLASPPTINYSVSGVYNVTLTVANSTGSTSSITQITVNECAAPTSSFTAGSKAICRNQSVSFTNQSLDGISYQWNFAGGSPATSTLATPPSILYSTPGVYNVTLTVTNSNGSVSSVQQVTVNGCTGISEHSSALDMVIYPNPCSGILFIRGNADSETTIEICDLAGKVVLSKAYSKLSEIEMDLSGLNSGIYFLKMQSSGQFKVSKLIIED